MPVTHDAALIATIRDHARRRVETTSLRAVAKEVGMSPTGLSKFLWGANPYAKTMLRLTEWFLLHGNHPVDYPSFEGTVAAIRILSGFFPRGTTRPSGLRADRPAEAAQCARSAKLGGSLGRM
jgi:hypothetical protein